MIKSLRLIPDNHQIINGTNRHSHFISIIIDTRVDEFLWLPPWTRSRVLGSEGTT
eukprot:Awhi_evm2s6160